MLVLNEKVVDTFCGVQSKIYHVCLGLGYGTLSISKLNVLHHFQLLFTLFPFLFTLFPYLYEKNEL